MDVQSEIDSGDRFSFGANWMSFLERVSDKRIKLAVLSLQTMLGRSDLNGLMFLDVGSGSGLFSLAARILGARVHSFDYDPQSVACTAELRRRFFPDDETWIVEHGSILDDSYVRGLGRHDVVYSWGVLHHTGSMWKALENVSLLVKENSSLFIAIYNDQRFRTRIWKLIKRLYNFLPRELRWLVLGPALVRLWGPRMLFDFLRGKPFYTWRCYAEHSRRGMSAWQDFVDWVGGLPFEAARPDDVFRFYRDRGFELRELVTCGGGLGCNEYVFSYSAKR